MSKSPITVTTESVESAPAADKLSMVLAAFNSAPASQITAFGQLVLDVAKNKGVDYHSLTAGRKAAFTRRVKEAVKLSGVTL